MKTRLAVILATILLPLGIVTFTAHSAYAGAANNNICHENGNGTASCLNNEAGRAENGNPVQFWAYGSQGEPYNDWHANLAGYVTSNNPFTDGSELNSRYDGSPIYQLQWSQNTEYCATGIDYEPGDSYGPVVIAPCTGSSFQWFVESGSGFWVNVGSSNANYLDTDEVNQPIWLGSINGNEDLNGDPVQLTPEVAESMTFGIYVAHSY